MSEMLDPLPLFKLIAAHVPADLHRNILVVGSLAAAYHFREKILLDPQVPLLRPASFHRFTTVASYGGR